MSFKEEIEKLANSYIQDLLNLTKEEALLKHTVINSANFAVKLILKEMEAQNSRQVGNSDYQKGLLNGRFQAYLDIKSYIEGGK